MDNPIKYITYEVVSKCDMDCRFCFSYWRDHVPELNTEEAKEVITIMKEKGLEAINFTGGEPLLRKDLGELLKFSKSKGLTTILSTNGTRLRQRLDEIAGNVDFIGLPLDSSDPQVHNEMRPTRTVSNHYQTVLDLLDLISKSYVHIGVKINTLVSGKNMDTVPTVADLIKEKVISWKLSQFIPGAYGGQHTNEFEISNEDYNGVVREARSRAGTLPIVVASAYSCDNGCRIISPQGHLLKPVRAELKDMGRITRDLPASAYQDFDSQLNLDILEETYLQHGR
ncbi:MAG: radical SAM protein [archaeon]